MNRKMLIRVNQGYSDRLINAGAIIVSQATPFAERKGSGHAAADVLSLRNAIIKQCSYKI